MSQIEVFDVHTTIGESCMEGSETLSPEALSEILSECRHTSRFLSTDGRIEGGRIPVESVKRLAEVLLPHNGQIVGWIAANPHFLEEGLKAVTLGVRQFGMPAVGEMVQYMEDWVTDEYKALPIVQLAGDLDVSISFHAGEAEHVEGVIHLAESFPKTRFSMCHFGGRAWRIAWRLAKEAKLPNLWVEISVGDPRQVQSHRAEQISAAIDAVGIERIVFATDFCIRPGAKYPFGNWLIDTLEGMKLKDGEIERICSLNAREILKLNS